MEKFEIHITGNYEILEFFEKKNLKTLEAFMYNKEGQICGYEPMSSFVMEFENYQKCKNFVDNLVKEIESENIEIIRVKIECPYYEKHYWEQSVYMECHFPKFNDYYPYVENKKSHKFVSTCRVMDKWDYSDFVNFWTHHEKSEIEVCLYDDNIRHDDKWIKSFL